MISYMVRLLIRLKRLPVIKHLTSLKNTMEKRIVSFGINKICVNLNNQSVIMVKL